MSGFSFSFSGDDIEDEHEEEATVLGLNEDTQMYEPQSMPPQSHSLESMLQSLPSHISFSTVEIFSDQGVIHLPRRELFDIRTQLMAEDAAGSEDLLRGLDKGDLSSGVYEGGFKTWECSLDLARYILDMRDSLLEKSSSELHCIEVGAGTAIASLAVLGSYLGKSPAERPASLHLTLCDYNEAVLRLATVSNILLVWHSIRGDSAEEGELDLEGDILNRCITDLQANNISVGFISGSWGTELARLAAANETTSVKRLILASETIYSPSSVGTFSDTLANLLEGSESAIGYVAAKKLYFGVGGGVDDFREHMERRRLGCLPCIDVEGAGVGRVVLMISQKKSGDLV